MKKLLALITAPLSMTACIDLTEPDANVSHPGIDGGSSEAESQDKGFAAVRAAYNNTEFVPEFDLSDTVASASVATTNACLGVDTLKGHFNAVASFSNTGSDIMTTREGELSTEAKTAIYDEDKSFFTGKYKINGWNYETAGYLNFALDDSLENTKLELTSNEYIAEMWHPTPAINQAVITIRDNVTQIWRTGLAQDVFKLTDSIYSHRTISSEGRKTITVFNTNTLSSYVYETGGSQPDVDTETSCFVAGADNSNFEMYIQEARELDFIGSEMEFDNVDHVQLFERPVFDYTQEEIEEKLGLETAVELV